MNINSIKCSHCKNIVSISNWTKKNIKADSYKDLVDEKENVVVECYICENRLNLNDLISDIDFEKINSETNEFLNKIEVFVSNSKKEIEKGKSQHKENMAIGLIDFMEKMF